jgi:hypothetical protein
MSIEVIGLVLNYIDIGMNDLFNAIKENKTLILNYINTGLLLKLGNKSQYKTLKMQSNPKR